LRIRRRGATGGPGEMEQEEYDYVVIGAGSAGCVVAARLTEPGRHTVALLEAGGDDAGLWVNAPLGFGRLFADPERTWGYETEPEPGLDGARMFQIRGRMLGGTGSLNGMIYCRGQAEDFDHWARLGNAGWGYRDVLPYFRRSEDSELGAGPYHGSGGPLAVTRAKSHPLADAFIAAGVEAGYPRNDDCNGASQEGFGYNQLTIRNGRRCSTSAGFLRPVRHRANLRVLTHATATRVVFEGRRARAVVYRHGGVERTVRARAEVVVCAGSFNAPALLQLSGVGDAAHLRSLGIGVVGDLPGVGENLQDHFGAWGTYRCTQPITLNDVVNHPLRRYAMGLRYLVRRDGLMASNATYAGACIRSEPSLAAPDLRYLLTLWCRAGAGRDRGGLGLLPFPSFTVVMTLQHPDSRGHVRIASPDPLAAPSIRFNFLTSPKDVATAVRAMRILRRIMSMPAITPFVAEELGPGPRCASDDDLAQFCRRNGRSSYHGSGTCRMGVDDRAVVDPRLRVRGVAGLRVVDASVMPRVVAGNTNAATIMIAEKGAAMILEDADRPAG